MFLSDPTTGPVGGEEVVIAQLTLGAQQPLEATVNLLGRSSVDEITVDSDSGLLSSGEWNDLVSFTQEITGQADLLPCDAEVADLVGSPSSPAMVDVMEVLKAMGMTNCDLRADVNGDCIVNTQDLLIVIGHSEDTDCATLDTCSLGAFNCTGSSCTAGTGLGPAYDGVYACRSARCSSAVSMSSWGSPVFCCRCCRDRLKLTVRSTV